MTEINSIEDLPSWAQPFVLEHGLPWKRETYAAFLTTFLEAHPGVATKFGALCHNDGGWSRELIHGTRDFQLSSLERAVDYALKWDGINRGISKATGES